ncbi:MAG: hypothetical protein OEY36_00380 [Gammaproteobacteria bacterium]|nr:hypothetical protein [Gammaproteobacteria bacterium]
MSTILFRLLIVLATVLSMAACSSGGGGGGANIGGDTTGNVAASDYNVGGSITGLTGSIVLQNNGADDITISANGSYYFTVPSTASANYSVTVLTQPVGQTCTVSNGVGQLNQADVGNVIIACADIDTDGDGLGDNDESLIYGTSPLKRDTDGDGISDFDEIVTYSFNPSLNNYEYNPLIADVPVIDIDIVTAPDIALNYEFSNGSSGTATTSRSSSNTSAVTTSKTNSNSSAIEASNTTGTELKVGAEMEISMSPSLTLNIEKTWSSSYTNTTSTEKSFSWSNDQSLENSNAYESAKSIEASNTLASSGGYIATAVKVSNKGSRAFTLTSLTLSSALISQTSNTIIAPVSNLTFDVAGNSTAAFPSTSLAGNESTGNIVFSAASLDTTTIKNLLSDSSGMKIGVAAYELVDINGIAFAYAREQVNASTATVIIDYETLSKEEQRFLVATVADPSTLTVTAQSVMENTLNIPHAVDSSGRLSSIDNVAGDGVVTGWLVLHKTTNASGVETATIHSYNTNYDFNTLRLKAGDVLHMVYQIDEDGDLLGRRMEEMLGTDINNADTDGDGLSDYDEAFVGWVIEYPVGNSYRVSSSPALSDTDGDGWTDLQEMNALTDPRNPDTDGDFIADSVDPNPLTADYLLHATNVVASFVDVNTTTGNATLNWGHSWPAASGFSSGRDIVLRQINSSAAYTSNPVLPEIAPTGTAVLTSVGNWLACGSVSNCWEVVAIQATSSSDGIGTYSFTDNGLNRSDTFRYAIVSEYNDGLQNYYMFDAVNPPVETTTSGSIKRITITMTLITMDANCTDYMADTDTDSTRYSNCEPFYSVRYNNNLIASRYSTPKQADTNYIYYTSGSAGTGALTPAYTLWTAAGSWTDATNPDTALRSGAASAYIDVIDTITSVPLQITAGDRDATVSELGYNTTYGEINGADDSKTVTVNVSANNLLVGTNATVGSSVAWTSSAGVNEYSAGSVSFTYQVTVTNAP